MHRQKINRPLAFGRRLSVVVTTSGLLAACTVGPDFVTPPSPDVSRYLPDERPARDGRAGAAAGVVWGADV
ncbi:MAG: hypothetical protein J0I16_21590, partial [Rhizobiales bacterium]|nr:hypothetical protein [Hyphomicrobiales bacterium]